jgi:CheY-like chemotaxis protein
MKKILVVDDEKEIRDLIRERLAQEKGYSVITAADGEEALNICKTSPLDLILLDIAMPGIDGYLTCEKLRQDKNTAGVPILFLTGKDLEPQGIIEHCKELDVSGYISKTSTLSELLAKIKETIKS